MFNQYVRHDSLSCLLNRDCQVEIKPEPFRMQGSLTLCVTYSEYKNYILSLPAETYIKLSADYSLLHNLASTDSPRLYNYFLRDISFAIAKEVCYAEAYGKRATVILPTSLTCGKTSLTQFLNTYSFYYQNSTLVSKHLSDNGFAIRPIKNPHNRRLYNLSTVLQELAQAPVALKEIGLVYD